MKIVIGFSKPSNVKLPLFSWLIRAFYRTEYSHVYVRWFSRGAKVDVVYEASGTSVKFKAKRIFDKKVKPIHEYEVEISDEQYRSLLNYCMTNAGTEYGIMQALGIGVSRIFGKDKNVFSDSSRQICSELVGHIIQDVMEKNMSLDLEMAGPPEIKDFLDRCPEFAQKTL